MSLALFQRACLEDPIVGHAFALVSPLVSCTTVCARPSHIPKMLHARTLVSGAVFGSALLVSGLCGPYESSWFRQHDALQSSSLVQLLLAASATTSCVWSFSVRCIAELIVIPLCPLSLVLLLTGPRGLGLFAPQPRVPSSKNIFPRLTVYDGNIAGGLLQGVGMALSGTDPGTTLVLAVSSLSTSPRDWPWDNARPAFVGSLLGGLAYRGLERHIARPAVASTQAKRTSSAPTTLTGLLRLPDDAAPILALGSATACLYLIRGGHLSLMSLVLSGPIRGGFLLGLAQLFSILTRRKTIGISTFYEDVWSSVTYAQSTRADGGRDNPMSASVVRRNLRVTLSDSTVFAIGVGLGSSALARCLPALPSLPSTRVVSLAPTIPALFGGFLTILGSRIAGGCTSGHGLSGTPTLGLASLITAACILIGGIPVAMVLS